MTPAEESVLAGLLGSAGGCLHEISLRPQDFSTPTGELIYTLIQDAVEVGKPADAVTISNDTLRLDPAGKRLATPEQIWELAGVYVPEASVAYHAVIVAEHAARRGLVTIANTIATQAGSGQNIAQMVDTAQGQLAGLTNGLGSTTRAITDTIGETIAGLDKPPTYIETPWQNLNDMIQGWRKGGLYIIGARPSVGKTVVGFQAALTLTNVGPVAYTSLEMGEPELQKRMIAQDAGVDMSRINRNNLSNDDMQRAVEAQERWGTVPLYIDQSHNASMAQIERHAWSVKQKHGLTALVVDYLGLVEGKAGQKEYEVVTETSRKLKLLAQALDVPVIALSQLNRGSESRDGKVPQMSDLRSSGAVEQDADVVVLLHRDLTETPHEMDLIVAKNRHGITGTAHMDFVGHHAKIRDQ